MLVQIETFNNFHILQHETAWSKTTVQNEPFCWHTQLMQKIRLWKMHCQYTASVQQPAIKLPLFAYCGSKIIERLIAIIHRLFR